MLVILDKLNFYLYKFWGFLKPRRKLGLVSFVVLASFVLVVWVVGTNVAHAAGVLDDVGDFFGWHPIDALANGIFQMIINIMLQIARWFIQLTFWILKFVIEIGGYNGYIDSPAVTVGWVMVRDITNMFFVVVLLIISFGTILGLEQYEYKKLLVKLLMAAVIVNFSRIICGIIIDVAQVIMITFINGIAATGDGNLLKMFHIEAMYKLKGGTAGSGVFMTAVAAITFASIMMVTMLTFLFLLLARMVMLWILIVLSPFAFVLNVLPQTQKYAGQWWSEFGGNVVAGPIIAFFLWLSFVTVGAGDARTHLANNSTTSWKEGATPQETTTGITEIMSWENMANFAIAIGMLLAGAKMAQQLGAAGGSMMGKAGEFGKKVAMVASGATAARWAGRGIVKGAKATGKFAAMNVPLVGGKSWQRRGRGIAARASVKWNKFNEKRNATAKFAEEFGKGEKGMVGWLKRRAGGLAAGTMESQGRKEKRVKDWETNAENQKKIVDETFSVSSASGGVAKNNTNVRLAQVMALGEAQKQKKEVDEESRIRSRVGMMGLQEKLDKAGTDEEKATISGQLDEEKQNYEKKYGEKFKANGDDYLYKKRMDKAGSSKADAELTVRDIAKEKELDIGKKKDEALIARGEPGKANFLAGVQAAHQKELEDAMDKLTYTELTKRGKILVKEMQKMESSVETGSGAYRKAAADAAAAMSATMKKGQDTAMAALEGSAKEAGFKATIAPGEKPGDGKMRQRQVLSALVGKNVSGTSFKSADGKTDTLSTEDAIKKFNAIHGDNAGTIWRNLGEAFKKATIDGSVDMAALINDAEMNDKGRIKYRLNGHDENGKAISNEESKAKVGEDYKGDDDYRESTRNVLARSIDVSRLVSLTGGMMPANDQGSKQFIAAFNGMKRGTKLQSRLLEEMTGMLQKDPSGKPTTEFRADAPATKAQFQKMFTEFLATNKEGAKAMLGNLGKFADALHDGEGEIAKALGELNRENRSGDDRHAEPEPEKEPQK